MMQPLIFLAENVSVRGGEMKLPFNHDPVVLGRSARLMNYLAYLFITVHTAQSLEKHLVG